MKPTQKGGTQPGADDAGVDSDEGSGDDSRQDKERPVNPRDEVIARMDAKVAAQRADEMQRAEEEGITYAEKMDGEDDSEESDDDGGTEEGADDEAPPQKATKPAPSAASQTGKGGEGGGADPLSDYVTVVDGKAMFRARVDGQERLIPLETARGELQKHVAANIRLQQAAEANKQLNSRAAAITAREQELLKREKRSGQPSVSADADDQSLDIEARDLAKALLTEPEDKVAERLKKVLVRTRQASAPLDEEAIADRAASKAVGKVLAQNKAADIDTGFQQFGKDYPEIMADENLFRIADGMTDAIEQENPSWNPSQVMSEAGKRTRAWMASMRGGTPGKGANPNNGRQQRKANLKPLPTARGGRQQTSEQEEVETPQSVLADIRRARGQA